MQNYLDNLLQQNKNFIFLGESGSGKTEIAVNFAMEFAQNGINSIHFFDLDQTKPLFRSRDILEQIENAGIIFHYEKQRADAPTIGGGTAEMLNDLHAICILDIGGNQQGSRMIGRYAHLTKRADTANYFVINPYRPWSRNIQAIDRTMAEVLGMARIDMKNTSIICNPNSRQTTTPEEILQGIKKTKNMLNGYLNIDCVSIEKHLYDEIKNDIDIPIVLLNIYMKYEWE